MEGVNRQSQPANARPSSATKLGSEVSRMFDAVAERYDLTNDVLSLGVDRLWRIATVKAVAPQPGQKILDLAAGTGTSSASFAAKGAHVTAVDFSEGMLEVGRERHSGNPLIEFVWGDASDLPFADNSFDTATISYGLRNVQDTMKVLREMRRVIVPGGKVVIAEFSTPMRPLRTPYRLYTRHLLPRIAGFVGGSREAYEYLNESITDWPDQESLAAMLREAGFSSVAYRNLSGGIAALHRGWKVAADSEDAE